MLKKWPILVCGILLFGATYIAKGADVIDRIVATVNSHIILQSDWDDAVAYEAFIGGKPVQQLTAEDRKAALDRLIDRELLRQQMPVNDPQFEPDEQTINSRVQDVRKQAGAETDQEWHALMARYDLSDEELRNHVVMQLKVLRLIDEHLTSTIQIDDKNIEDYYNQTFLPQVRQKGAKAPTLAEVTPKIRELLTQQKLNDALREWLQNLRDTSAIVVKVDAAPNGGSAK